MPSFRGDALFFLHLFGIIKSLETAMLLRHSSFSYGIRCNLSFDRIQRQD